MVGRALHVLVVLVDCETDIVVVVMDINNNTNVAVVIFLLFIVWNEYRRIEGFF